MSSKYCGITNCMYHASITKNGTSHSPVSTCCTSYMKGVTNKIGRILKRASNNTYFQPPKKINQFLRPVKCNPLLSCSCIQTRMRLWALIDRVDKEEHRKSRYIQLTLSIGAQ
ncbi:unnamed protein product [Diatraea saccharalis]|uniref:Uncharacterized protein n=1 Tax=Diatraea saccharalis TaxID=40085 RepID=A0A9N9WI28_9NEOP|nr:unnamed protein product [Diatraea saccharalis]